MKKWLIAALLCALTWSLRAQEPYPELGAKLEEYFTALSGEPAAVQNAECDFLISSCQDSLVREYVARKIYSHYYRSHIMGDDAVAVHVARKWFLSGEIAMASEEDLEAAKIFVTFNSSSLIGADAPLLTLLAPSGEKVTLPQSGSFSVLYFYDTGCASCKLETLRLEQFVASAEYDVKVYAIYTGADEASWTAYQKDFEGVTHVWDPSVSSDWQLKYGVLKTPSMFLVSPTGVIIGRGLDTPALRILLNQQFSASHYVYGEASQMERYNQLFSAFGDSLSVRHIMEVADYLAARTFGEGDMDSFKQVAGDLVYYLSSRREEVYHDAYKPFYDKYIAALPDVWNTEDDKSQVVSFAQMQVELASRTPVGSLVPDITVPGTLRRRPCLFRKGTKEGNFSLRRLKGRPAYVVFYTGGCTACKETLEAVDALVARDRRAKVLLVDMDALLTDNPETGRLLLDSFDLSGMPFTIQLNRDGVVEHRYVIL